MAPVLTTTPRLSQNIYLLRRKDGTQAAAFVTITSSEGPEQAHLVRDLRQGRDSVLEVRPGDRLSWPIHFTSPARHGGARLRQISGNNLVADRLYVFTPHKSFSPPGAASALFREHAID